MEGRVKAEGLHAYVDTLWISDIHAQMVRGMESRGSTHLYGNVLYFWDTFSVTQIPVTLLIVTDVGWGGRFHAGCVETSTIPVLHLTQRGDAVFFVTYVATKGVENRNFLGCGEPELNFLAGWFSLAWPSRRVCAHVCFATSMALCFEGMVTGLYKTIVRQRMCTCV